MRANLALLFTTVLVANLPAQAGPSARSEDLGGGCGPYTVAPQLGITPPVLGTTARIALGSAMPATYGELWASLGPPVLPPTVLGGLCPVFVDLGAAVRFSYFVTDNSGGHQMTVAVPGIPALAGTRLTFQVFLVESVSSFWPLPYISSNGVAVTLGS